MSTTYNIDFSEPTKAGFQIKSGQYNGPGGPQANTTLRLFGRGAREWGEAVDEDLVRLAENFASASAPSVAISGQIWIETALYYRNTSESNPLAGWYRYNVDTKTWALIGGTGVVSGAAMSTPTVGHYYASGGVLRGYYTLGKYEPAAYLVRASTTGVGAPGALTPAQTMYVYDANANGGAGQWVPQTATVVTNGPTPGNPRTGILWYNTANGNLSVYTGSTWQNVVGPTNSGGNSGSSGILNMNNFRIINLATPTQNTDATTKQYVDQAIAGVSGSLGGYLPLSGGTLSGPGNLAVNGTFNVGGAAGFGTTLNANGAVGFGSTLYVAGATTLASSASVGGGLTVYNSINIASGNLTISSGGGANIFGNVQMNGSGIFGLGQGGSGDAATNKNYVDTLHNQAIAHAETKLYAASVSGPYLGGNGRPEAPIGANIAAIKSAIFSSLSCGDAAAMRQAMINCGYWGGGGSVVGGTGIGPGG